MNHTEKEAAKHRLGVVVGLLTKLGCSDGEIREAVEMALYGASGIQTQNQEEVAKQWQKAKEWLVTSEERDELRVRVQELEKKLELEKEYGHVADKQAYAGISIEGVDTLLNRAVTGWIVYAEQQKYESEEYNKAWRVVSLLEGALAIAGVTQIDRDIGSMGQATASSHVARGQALRSRIKELEEVIEQMRSDNAERAERAERDE